MFACRRVLAVGALLAGLGAVLLTARAEEAESPQQAEWRTLARLCLQFSSELDSQSEFTNGGARYMVAYRDWKAEFVHFWTDFKRRYGGTRELVKPHFEGVAKPDGIPQGIDYLAWSAGRIDLGRHEEQLLRWAEEYAKSQYGHWKRLYDQDHENVEVMMRHGDRSLGFLRLAARMNPEGDYAADLKAAEEAVALTLPRYKAQLETKEWPAHNTSYQGADTPDALAAAALAFLREHPDWTAPEFDDDHEPTAAVVSGSAWTVYKAEPLTRTPLQHAIKILVAFRGTTHPDLAYCYFMEFYTADGLDVKPALPFAYCNSRQHECYRMLRAKLPD